MNAQEMWQQVLEQLREALPRSDFETWLQGTVIVEANDSLVTISTPNSGAKQWIERNIADQIRKRIATIMGYSVQIRIVVAKAGSPSKQTSQKPATPGRPKQHRTTRTNTLLAITDHRKLLTFQIEDVLFDDYAPILQHQGGFGVIVAICLMAKINPERQFWFSQGHIADHFGISRTHHVGPTFSLLEKLQIIERTGRRTTNGGIYYRLNTPPPILDALLHLLDVEDEERLHPVAPAGQDDDSEEDDHAPTPPPVARTIPEKLARINELYPHDPHEWRAVRQKVSAFPNTEAVLAAIEQALQQREQALMAPVAPPLDTRTLLTEYGIVAPPLNQLQDRDPTTVYAWILYLEAQPNMNAALRCATLVRRLQDNDQPPPDFAALAMLSPEQQRWLQQAQEGHELEGDWEISPTTVGIAPKTAELWCATHKQNGG